MNIKQILGKDFNLRAEQVDNVINLLENDATIPFIARYRKDATGGIDEIVLREIRDRYDYLKELETRKVTVLQTIEGLGKLTEELKEKIDTCLEKTVLEDLYLPYKPKKRSRAVAAMEKGLGPLLDWIVVQTNPLVNIEDEAAKYVDAEKGVNDCREALMGAADIFAECVAEKAENRVSVRSAFLENGVFVSKAKKAFLEKKTKFSMYYDYRSSVNKISSHNMLALRRGAKEGIIGFEIEADDESLINELSRREVKIAEGAVSGFLKDAVKDSYERLIKPSISTEVRLVKKQEADQEAILIFGKNLQKLLLSSPAGQVSLVAVDPGFRTGCKVAVLDTTGQFLEYQAIFPHERNKRGEDAKKTLLYFIEKYSPQFIVIGNGTASRETERFIKQDVVDGLDEKKRPVVLIVSEAGASVYSASQSAINEFPELDITVRGAISIGRRLMDPLAELVKIEPKSIGVGQYQHDVDQKFLKNKLGEIVESCVNYVGVDLNSASVELLSYVSGIRPKIAENIVLRRNEKGPFLKRDNLLDVAGLGEKTFLQSAGFLRIKGMENLLDDSAVHPESYYVVKKIAEKFNTPLEDLIGNAALLEKIEPADLIDEQTGVSTVMDILEELKKPGRDPRSTFTYATFREDVNSIEDLSVGMTLQGVATNVTNFGAFVDIGVHQDGLVHISQLADRFVKDPTDVVNVGDTVNVKIIDIDVELKRIALSMRVK